MDGLLKVYTDGGSRGNPGPSASAFVVLAGEKIIYKGSKFLGKRTNNQAEYNAVIIALKWLSKNSGQGKKVLFYLDSELVVRQLTGVYKIKDLKLGKLAEQIKLIESKLDLVVSYTSIVREKNQLADKLVNKELDSVLKS